MANQLGHEPRPDLSLDDLPPDVREALRWQARLAVALRLYRRRGWNDSALQLQYSRQTARVRALLEKLEFDEMNPALF